MTILPERGRVRSFMTGIKAPYLPHLRTPRRVLMMYRSAEDRLNRAFLSQCKKGKLQKLRTYGDGVELYVHCPADLSSWDSPDVISQSLIKGCFTDSLRT